MKTSDMPRIRIYHNNLWARYKGAIFSKIHTGSDRSGVATSFVQVTETSTARIGLGGVDRSYHRYPFEVLFPGAYEQIPRYKIVAALSANLLRNRSDLVVIPGYHRVEYWVMLVLCMLLRRKRAVFVDSTAYDRDKIAWKEAAKGFFFRRCDGFFCYGIRSKEYVASYGIDERKIYDRCQAAALPHDYDPETIRGYYGRIGRSVDAPPRFLYVGRLSVEKGLADLLEAFRGVRAQLPDARLDIVGSGPSSSNSRNIRSGSASSSPWTSWERKRRTTSGGCSCAVPPWFFPVTGNRGAWWSMKRSASAVRWLSAISAAACRNWFVTGSRDTRTRLATSRRCARH